MTTVRARLALLAVAVALLAGCTSGSSDEPAATREQASAPAERESPDAAGSSSAGVEDVDPSAAIVSQTVTVPDSPEDQVEVGVLSLEVQGEVMKLRLAVTPRFASASDDDSISLFAAFGQTGFRPKLVDVDNLKQYSVVGSDDGPVSSEEVQTEASNGSPMLAYAYFAAPEDDIGDIDLRVTDFWPTFTDVPITR